MQGAIKHFPLIGLAAGLAILAPASAAAQETQAGDSTVQAQPGDSGEIQNPPGYRGMERPVNVFPPDSGAADSAGQVEDRATGTYDDSTWQDTAQGRQNPAGYRGMERPAGGDTSAADSSRIHPTDSAGTGAAAPTTRDSASVLPGDSSSIKPKSPTERIEPADSAGSMGP
jgi:hypothetical protein